MKRQTALIWLVPFIGAMVLAVDQVSKHWVSSSLAPGQSWMPIRDLEPLIRITHVQNTGAAFGMFPALGQVFLVIAVVVVIAISRYYYARAYSAPLWVRICLGLMLGGALGNMIDRVRIGYVVDFVDLGWWPVFNVADSSIVIGVTMLAIYMSFFQKHQPGRVDASLETVEPTAPPTA